MIGISIRLQMRNFSRLSNHAGFHKHSQRSTIFRQETKLRDETASKQTT